MKKVLLVTDVNFWEKCSGHRMRISALIEYLADHVQLSVINTGPAPETIEKTLRAQYNADFFILEKTKYLNSNGYGRRFKALMGEKKFDSIIIEYIHCSYFLNFLINDVNVILDTHDIISERTAEFKRFNHEGELYEMPVKTESEIFGVYDKVMAICLPDFEKINTIAGPGKALLCPHPVKPCPHPINDKVHCISFIASSYLPNKDAISFFIENCWPQIAATYPVKLCIYGTVGENLGLNYLPQIEWKGFVDDINKIYEDADIIINPVRFGTGLKIKNIEALAHGLPLVTTTHGARGIENGINEAFLVADTAAEFISSINSLIECKQLRKKLHDNALSFVTINFSVKRCFDSLLEEINMETAICL